jgi:hypothetical protein
LARSWSDSCCLTEGERNGQTAIFIWSFAKPLSGQVGSCVAPNNPEVLRQISFKATALPDLASSSLMQAPKTVRRETLPEVAVQVFLAHVVVDPDDATLDQGER